MSEIYLSFGKLNPTPFLHAPENGRILSFFAGDAPGLQEIYYISFQTIVGPSDQFHYVHSAPSSYASPVNRFRNSSTAIVKENLKTNQQRKKLLEQGLARARASIRKAGTSSLIVSPIAGLNQSDVDREFVYRNGLILPGPHTSRAHPLLYNTSIRVLCNANTSEGFNPQKDVSLPEIHLYSGKFPPQLLSPPPANTSRPYLAFFAGGLHGPIRPLLLNQWKDRDSDLRVFEYLPKNLDYYSFMLQSKFCLCPSGHEVASPRIVEAIYAECIPVILSKHYVLPFSDVLRWEAFSVKVNVSEIPRLKEVLRSVPEEKYMKLKEGLKAVRRHFVLNQPAERFDVFHMILHSIWLRRINLRLG
ncbi:hypothetical protein GH714_023491 [Hevea brasiliensis]|uniref:Exostosin GT47 domain-containing protein n=1 Tax=Hevea brasiliensis TaxID=3981 RepID=A0A6A6LQU8_HEVBR|nr:hypothetical protein GH714_023491 [Hevea brasiliensis]